jgi:hypothetical protein
VLLAEMVYNRVHNFNSLYFHQNLVSISFSGYLANIIKDAYKIVDDKNKYRNPNWRDDFIDNPNSNPVKLNIKQKLYVFYLIITGKIDKLISKIRSYLTNILITKEKDDAKNLLSLYQKEDVEKLMKECTNNENRLKLCKEKYARLQISLLEDYCIWQNLFFYIDKLICNIKNIYKIFPPTKNTIITQEDSINLNMNYSFYCKTYLECLNSLINIVILHREAKELGEVKFNSNIVYQYMPPYYKNWIEHSKELQYIIYSKETYDKNLHFQFGEVINKNENTYLSNLITPQIKNIDTIPQLHPLLNCSLLELLNLIDDLYKIFYLEDEQNPDLLDKYKQERQE